jgi:hypothetical protein
MDPDARSQRLHTFPPSPAVDLIRGPPPGMAPSLPSLHPLSPRLTSQGMRLYPMVSATTFSGSRELTGTVGSR